MWNGQPIGWCEVSCLGLVDGEEIDDWYDLRVGEGENVQGSIRLGLQFFAKGSLDTDGTKILPCYFPCREKNRVTLYQDADTPQLQVFEVGSVILCVRGLHCSLLQGLTSHDGSEYVPSRLWRDVYDTIVSAQSEVHLHHGVECLHQHKPAQGGGGP